MSADPQAALAAQTWIDESSVVNSVPRWQLLFNFFEPQLRAEFIEALEQAYTAGFDRGVIVGRP